MTTIINTFVLVVPTILVPIVQKITISCPPVLMPRTLMVLKGLFSDKNSSNTNSTATVITTLATISAMVVDVTVARVEIATTM